VPYLEEFIFGEPDVFLYGGFGKVEVIPGPGQNATPGNHGRRTLGWGPLNGAPIEEPKESESEIIFLRRGPLLLLSKDENELINHTYGPIKRPERQKA